MGKRIRWRNVSMSVVCEFGVPGEIEQIVRRNLPQLGIVVGDRQRAGLWGLTTSSTFSGPPPANDAGQQAASKAARRSDAALQNGM